MVEKIDRSLIRSVVVSSPVGEIVVSGYQNEFLQVNLPNNSSPQRDHHQLSPDYNGYPLLNDAVDFLVRYFNGEAVTWQNGYIPSGTQFMKSVWKTALSVPFGGLISYGELARLAGHPGAARAVGSAMAKNPVAILIPCHRIIASDGSLGGYGGGLAMKKWLIEHEKVNSR